MTFLDVVTMVLVILLAFGLWGMFLEWLNRGDKRTNRESQCPPHEWYEYFVDDPSHPTGYRHAGLKCGKCKNVPGARPWVAWRWPYGPP